MKLNTVGFECTYRARKQLSVSHYNSVILLVFDSELFVGSPRERRVQNSSRTT